MIRGIKLNQKLFGPALKNLSIIPSQRPPNIRLWTRVALPAWHRGSLFYPSCTEAPHITHASLRPPHSSLRVWGKFYFQEHGATQWVFGLLSPHCLVAEQQELTPWAAIGSSMAAALARSPGKDLYHQWQEDKWQLCLADSSVTCRRRLLYLMQPELKVCWERNSVVLPSADLINPMQEKLYEHHWGAWWILGGREQGLVWSSYTPEHSVQGMQGLLSSLMALRFLSFPYFP